MSHLAATGAAAGVVVVGALGQATGMIVIVGQAGAAAAAGVAAAAAVMN